MTSNTTNRLIDLVIELANSKGWSDRRTNEKLLDIFSPEELIDLGYTDRVLEYFRKYGTCVTTKRAELYARVIQPVRVKDLALCYPEFGLVLMTPGGYLTVMPDRLLNQDTIPLHNGDPTQFFEESSKAVLESIVTEYHFSSNFIHGVVE